MRNKRLIIIFSIFLSLTLLIAIGSAVFSIRRIDAYCYNSEDKEILDTIVNGKEEGQRSIREWLVGRSIFTLNEKELIKEVESRFAGVKVINIERLFPNRVSINFIKLYDYFEIGFGDKFYVFGKDGKISEALDEYSPDYIRVMMNLESEPEDISGNENFGRLIELTDALERLDYRGSDSVIIDFIDFTKAKDKIFIKMRSGVFLELQSYENLSEKLRKALSLYVAHPDHRLKGTIIVGNGAHIEYSQDNRYE